MNKKAALIILDGWGIGDGSKSDAIANAHTPVFDGLMSSYPNARLKTYGENVGLPAGQMGNSEVGHLNIGAGRIVYQDLLKINRAVEADEFRGKKVLKTAIEYAKQNGANIHLMGLLSMGGVHSSQEHLHGLIDMLEDECDSHVFIHAFTDGRDTPPKDAKSCVKRLNAHLEGKRTRLVSMIGRYYAMDRDNRWERIKLAYDLLLSGVGKEVDDFESHCQESYDAGITDEFFESAVIRGAEGRIAANDVVICFNFRTDRCRQITKALTQIELADFGMKTVPLHYITMTRYDQTFKGVHVVFEKDNLQNTLGEVVSKAGRTQLRIAETEKYPHVTFFFSGGREDVFDAEDRIVVASPKVATYDLQPEMSADEVTNQVVNAIENRSPDFVCLNYANPDMVGHTGVYDAIIKAVETADACLGRVIEAGKKQGYSFIVIADHGNADIAFEENGTPHTAHTTNPVPCILISDGRDHVSDGILADVAPTILELMELDQPSEMSGKSLI